MRSKQNLIAIGILGIALAIVIVILSGVSWNWRASAPTIPVPNTSSTAAGPSSSSSVAAAPERLLQPPHGAVTYQIAQAATQLPGFLQATIDPVDVQVGQVQHFVVVTSDPNPVTSVVAQITTDHKTITVPLVSQGAPAVSMLVPRTVAVDATGHLALITPGSAAAMADAASTNTAQGPHVANAATANDTKFTGEWTVEDTHTAQYKTTFIAKDSAGNTNSVTVAWLDPCTAFTSSNNYGGGTATVSGNCSLDSGTNGVSSVDGPENGNLLVSGATLTINTNATLVINANYSISFSGGGTIAIANTTAKILLGTQMCGTDADGDTYISGSNWTTSTASACSGTLLPRTNFTAGHVGDCNDGDANAHPGQTSYFTSAQVGTPGSGGPYDYNCDGVAQQYNTAVGTPSGQGGCSGPTSCNTYDSSVAGKWSGGVPACGTSGSLWVAISGGVQCSSYPTYYSCPQLTTASTPQSCL